MAGFQLQHILMKMMPSPAMKEQAELLRLQPLLEEIRRPLWAINAVISDAELRTMVLKEQDKLDDWVAEVGATLVDLEDLLASLIDRQEREAAESAGLRSRRSSSSSSAFLLPARFAFRRKLKKMKRSLDGLVERGNAFDLLREAMDSMDPFGDGYAAILKNEVLELEGRREEYERIMENLQQQLETFLKKNDEERFDSSDNEKSSSERDNDEETFLKKNDEEKFYSIDNEYDEFVNMDGEVPFTIVISGVEGQGKTTLAQMIYHDDWVRRHFHQYRFWVDASNFHWSDMEGIGREIARAIVGDYYMDIPETDSNINFQDMWVFADQCLAGRRYLLVLDDCDLSYWTRWQYRETRNEWNKFSRTLLSAGGPGSTIIITTNYKYEIYRENFNLELKGISEDDWRKIFMRWALTDHEQGKCKQQEEEDHIMARQIAMQLCEQRHWDREYRYRRDKWDAFDAKWKGSILRYTEISKWQEIPYLIHYRDQQHVELLGLYFKLHKKAHGMFYHSLFIDDDIFTLEESMHLMIAKGLLPLWRDKDLRLNYIRKAIRRFSFQWAKTTPYCFTINLDENNSLAVPKQSRHLCILFSSNNSTIRFPIIANIERKKLQTLVLRCNNNKEDAVLLKGPNKCQSIIISKRIILKLKYTVRALHLQGKSIQPPLDAIRRFHNLRYLNLSHTDHFHTLSKSLCSFPKLQILNLEYCRNLEKLSTQIHKLQRLQILKLAYCEKLQMLPPTIIRLGNLQELNLEGCLWLIQLPQGVSNLKSLAELNIYGCTSLTRMPHGVGELTNLLRLSGYHATDEFGSTLIELQNLVNLIELRLEKLERVWSSQEIVGVFRLQKKTNLKYLTLHWQWWSIDPDFGLMVEPEASSLQELEPLEDDFKSSRGDDSKVRIPLEQESSIELHVQQLKDLEPYRPSLEKLEIISYAGDKWPSWILDVSSFKSLKEIKLINIKRCKGLPPFLNSFDTIEISGMDLISINENINLRVELILSEMLKLENLSVVNYTNHVGLLLIQCPNLPFVSIQNAWISNLSLWLNNRIILASESNPWKIFSILDEVEIVGCQELKFLPRGMKYIQNLIRLRIISCSNLISLPGWMGEGFSKLYYLEICNCPALKSIPSIPWQNLIEIRIEGCPKLQLLHHQVPEHVRVSRL